MTDPTSSAPSDRLRAATELLVGAALVLALVTAAIAFLLPPSGVGRCASYPSCLAAPPSAALAAHTDLGALLGLAILGALLGSVLLRRRFPASLPRAIASFVVVVIMGGIGGGLFTGALPSSFVFVQVGMLALLLVLLALLLASLRPGPAVPSSLEGTTAGAPAS